MPRAEIHAQALVLKRVDYGEADRIVTLLTEVNGKRTVFAGGARKSPKRYGGGLEPFRLIEVRYSERDEGRLARMVSAQTVEAFDELARDLHPLYWATLCLELVEATAVEGQPSGVFQTLVRALRWMSGEREPWMIEVGCLRFLMVLLDATGSLPALSYCVRSGKAVGADEEPFFSTSGGGLIHPDEVRPDDHAVRVSRDVVRFLECIAEGRFPTDRSPGSLRESRRLVLEVFHALLGRRARTLQLLESAWL